MTPEAFQKLIEALKTDLKIYSDMMKEVANDIMTEGFSKYPVFLATEHELSAGELILAKDDYAATFSIYASTMEELLEKKLLSPDKKAAFMQAFKNPKSYMCVMLITSSTASVAFYPYNAREQVST
ncbi:MAG: hypothetical protein ACK45I_11535 [Bacteroidota bacterium]|jgi:hypothetical protein